MGRVYYCGSLKGKVQTPLVIRFDLNVHVNQSLQKWTFLQQILPGITRTGTRTCQETFQCWCTPGGGWRADRPNCHPHSYFSHISCTSSKWQPAWSPQQGWSVVSSFVPHIIRLLVSYWLIRRVTLVLSNLYLHLSIMALNFVCGESLYPIHFIYEALSGITF